MSNATKTHRTSGERDSSAPPCSNGTVMHGPLFLDDDLLGAADECGLTPRDDADAASCADWLNEQALVAVSFGAADSLRPPPAAALARLGEIERSASRLLGLLGLLDVNVAEGRMSWSVRRLLGPGLAHPPVIPMMRELVRNAGPELERAVKDSPQLAVLMGCDEKTASAHAINCALAEAGLRLLPPALAVLRSVLEQAAVIIEAEAAAKIGRKRDSAADILLGTLATAHQRMFGHPPQLRNEERGRDTASVRWIKLLLETAAARSEQGLGAGSAQAQKVCDLANLALATLNNKLAEVMPENSVNRE